VHAKKVVLMLIEVDGVDIYIDPKRFFASKEDLGAGRFGMRGFSKQMLDTIRRNCTRGVDQKEFVFALILAFKQSVCYGCGARGFCCEGVEQDSATGGPWALLDKAMFPREASKARCGAGDK
jgi:hypothetical protein